MKIINLSIKLILPILFIWGCKNKEEERIEINIPKLLLSAGLGGKSPLDTSNTIYIATTLYNPSVDTIKFLSMSCSYEDFFLTDSGYFKVVPFNICFGNVPVLVDLPPGRKMDHYITIRPTVNLRDLTGQKVRIGMYYVSPIGRTENFDLSQNRFKAPVIWSNQLDLQRLYRKSY